MAKTADHSYESIPHQDAPRPDEIKQQLRNILTSPAFLGSKRCQQFLEYVCDKSLTGDAGALKERTIATEVFGRRPQSDLGEDTIVRVGAREVRKRLAQYYVTPAGAASDVRIDLLPGSYAPEFRYSPSVKDKEETPVSTVAPEPAKRRRWAPLAMGTFLLLITAVAATFILNWKTPSSNQEAFRRFWEPVFQSSQPLLVAVGHPIVYHLSARAHKKMSEHVTDASSPMQRPVQLPAADINGSDIIPVFNQYVGFGDMVAATQVSSLLSSKGKTAEIRLASSVQFADLRQSPSLLIGATTNRWTVELQQQWRFQFSRAPDLKIVITDTADPNHRHWGISSKDDGSAPDDYFLVCRMRNSLTGGFVIAAAGLKQFGTEAAGRLLADADRLGVLLRSLPANWVDKNLQVVLHAKVINDTPAQPELIAWHVW